MKPAHSGRREVILYFTFGVGTMVLAFLTYLAVFGVAEHWLHIPMADKTTLAYTVTYTVAQLLQWLVALLSAFYTNRKWVFTEADHGKGTFWHQLWLFSGSRVFTFFLDLAATGLIHLLSLWLTPDNAPILLGVKLDAELWAKVMVSALVIAANYYFSKLLVFKKKK